MDKITLRIEAIAMIYLHKNAAGKTPEELVHLYVEARDKIKRSIKLKRASLDL